MRNLRQVLSSTRSLMSRITGRLQRRVKELEHMVAVQDQRLAKLESLSGDSIHSLEMAEDHRRSHEGIRRNSLSDRDLRIDLRRQYGTTKWSMKLINDIVDRRNEARDNSYSIDYHPVI